MKSALFAGVSAVLAALASAVVTPVGTNPSGNSIIKPGLNEIVPAGKPYAITWDPTTAGPVTLLLLRGPSTNVKPLYPIAEHVPNTGSYEWTPSTSLEPDVTHYGIQLIDEKTGAFQYSTQFGISNSKPSKPSESSSPPSPPSSAPSVKPESVGHGYGAHPYGSPAYGSPSSSYATGVPPVYGGSPHGKPSIVYSTTYETATSCSCETETPVAAATYGSPTPYGAPPVAPYPVAPSGTALATGTGVPGAGANTTSPTYVAPSGPVYSSTGPANPIYTGAASQVKVGGVMVGIVAGLAVALF